MLDKIRTFFRFGKGAKPAPTDFADEPAIDQRPRRIPPHQRYRLMSAEERWIANASGRPRPVEPDPVSHSRPRNAG